MDIKESKYILEPCIIKEFIDIKILKEYVKKDLDSNREYFDDLNITYKISDPRKGEWILNKAIKNGKLVGNGNNNIDINIDNKIWIDVSVLTLNGNYTNEKSIMQNFSNSNDLDTLFNTNKGDESVEIFKNKLLQKYEYIDTEIDIYYMIFICKNKNIYLSCFKLIPQNIPNMIFCGFTKSCKNIFIENFIDINVGNVKLYKSKKRLELRLSKNIIKHECSILLY
jgi:hypothetical protein